MGIKRLIRDERGGTDMVEHGVKLGITLAAIIIIATLGMTFRSKWRDEGHDTLAAVENPGGGDNLEPPPDDGGFCPIPGAGGTTSDPLNDLLGGSAKRAAASGPMAKSLVDTAKAVQKAGCGENCQWSDVDREIYDNFEEWRAQPGNGSSDAITDQYAYWCSLYPPPSNYDGGCSIELAQRNHNIERGRIYQERGCISNDDFPPDEYRQARNIGCFTAFYSLPRAIGCIFLPGLPGPRGPGGANGGLPVGCDVEIYDPNHDYCAGPNPNGFPHP